MNNNSSTQWSGWQLPLTNEQQLWLFLVLLFFLSFVMLGPHIPMFWEDWAHWRVAAQQDRHQQHQGASQTRDQLERNGRRQAAAPYPENVICELPGTIRREDANHNPRISGVWRPPQGDLSIPVNDTNSNQQREIKVFTIDRWGSTTESSPRTDCMDLSEYEVHIEDTESGSSNPVPVPAPSGFTSVIAPSTSTPETVTLAPSATALPISTPAPVETKQKKETVNSWSNYEDDELDWGTDDDD